MLSPEADPKVVPAVLVLKFAKDCPGDAAADPKIEVTTGVELSGSFVEASNTGEAANVDLGPNRFVLIADGLTKSSLIAESTL